MTEDNKIARYIVVGPARSGTTVTHLCLKGHPNACALNDEMRVSPFFTKGVGGFTYGAETEEEKEKGRIALFDAITMIGADDNTQACGMKVAISNVEDAGFFVDAVQQHLKEVSIILTIREDLVAQCGSMERASKTGQYHSWVTPKSKEDIGLIHLPKNRFITYAIQNLTIIRLLSKLDASHNVIRFSYEKDILNRGLGNYHKLFSFLDLPLVEIDWLESGKVAPNPNQFIANYKELTGVLGEIKRLYGRVNDREVLLRLGDHQKPLFARIKNRFFSIASNANGKKQL